MRKRSAQGDITPQLVHLALTSLELILCIHDDTLVADQIYHLGVPLMDVIITTLDYADDLVGQPWGHYIRFEL